MMVTSFHTMVVMSVRTNVNQNALIVDQVFAMTVARLDGNYKSTLGLVNVIQFAGIPWLSEMRNVMIQKIWDVKIVDMSAMKNAWIVFKAFALNVLLDGIILIRNAIHFVEMDIKQAMKNVMILIQLTQMDVRQIVKSKPNGFVKQTII